MNCSLWFKTFVFKSNVYKQDIILIFFKLITIVNIILYRNIYFNEENIKIKII